MVAMLAFIGGAVHPGHALASEREREDGGTGGTELTKFDLRCCHAPTLLRCTGASKRRTLETRARVIGVSRERRVKHAAAIRCPLPLRAAPTVDCRRGPVERAGTRTGVRTTLEKAVDVSRGGARRFARDFDPSRSRLSRTIRAHQGS